MICLNRTCSSETLASEEQTDPESFWLGDVEREEKRGAIGVTLCGGWVNTALTVKSTHILSPGNTLDCVCVTLWVIVSVSVTKEEDEGALPVIHPFSFIYFLLEHNPSPLSPYTQCFSPLHFLLSLPLPRQDGLSTPLHFRSIFHCTWRMFYLPRLGKVQRLNRGETWHNMAAGVPRSWCHSWGFRNTESPRGACRMKQNV